MNADQTISHSKVKVPKRACLKIELEFWIWGKLALLSFSGSRSLRRQTIRLGGPAPSGSVTLN